VSRKVVPWPTVESTPTVPPWVWATHLVMASPSPEPVVPRTPGANLYPGADVYLKQGYYRTESAATSVIYHDGMRRGTSYAAVDPSTGG